MNDQSDNYAGEKDLGGYGHSKFDGPDIFTEDLRVRAHRVASGQSDPALIDKLQALANQQPYPSDRATNTLRMLGIEKEEIIN